MTLPYILTILIIIIAATIVVVHNRRSTQKYLDIQAKTTSQEATKMTLPYTLTLVRHGQSEANVVQQALRERTALNIPEEFFQRHDSNMRLTNRGVEQAVAAGEWLAKHGPKFDRFYVSPHTRTRETAYYLKLAGEWRLEDRIRERDWGEIHSVTKDFQDPQTDASRHNRALSAWYWKPQAGESLATGVRLRVESILNSLYRKVGINHVIAVTHGEFISTAQFVIERMTPDAWATMEADKSFKIQNTMIVQYTRVNPNNPEDVSHHFKWRRAICPWDESLSWNNGEWVSVAIKKYTDADLLASVEGFGRLL